MREERRRRAEAEAAFARRAAARAEVQRLEAEGAAALEARRWAEGFDLLAAALVPELAAARLFLGIDTERRIRRRIREGHEARRLEREAVSMSEDHAARVAEHARAAAEAAAARERGRAEDSQRRRALAEGRLAAQLTAAAAGRHRPGGKRPGR